jgi:hypothetical protein
MSFNAEIPLKTELHTGIPEEQIIKLTFLLYRRGLRKPRGLFPAAISLLFNNAIMLARVGDEALVPRKRCLAP